MDDLRNGEPIAQQVPAVLERGRGDSEAWALAELACERPLKLAQE